MGVAACTEAIGLTCMPSALELDAGAFPAFFCAAANLQGHEQGPGSVPGHWQPSTISMPHAS